MTVNNWKMGTEIAIAIAIILGAMYMVTRGDLNQVKSEFSALSDNYSTLSDKCDSISENLSKARSKLTVFREAFVYPN